MNKDEIKSHLESLAEDFAIEVSDRQIDKFTELALELKAEADITFDEIKDEFLNISSEKTDIWQEYVEEVSDFVFDYINDEYSSEDFYDDEE